MRGNMGYKLSKKSELEMVYNVDKMNKKWWGRRTWDLIHIFASYAPEHCTYDYFVSYRAFVTTLGKILPCLECRGHLVKNLKSMPMDCYGDSRLGLFSWSFKLHNTVNEQMNAPTFAWDKAVKQYIN